MQFINSSEEFKAIFNNSAVGIIITNDKAEIVLINDVALAMFLYEEGEVFRRPVDMLMPERFRTEYASCWAVPGEDEARQTVKEKELTGLRKNGSEFPMEVNLNPYVNAEGVGHVVAFVADIAIRKESEQALLRMSTGMEERVFERTQSISEALNKEKELNEMKSRFVSIASHEFRTPLSTVLSSAYLVARYQATEDQPKRDKHLQRIISSVNTLTGILNDFLSVGKIEEGKTQVSYSDFSITDFVKRVITEIKPICKKGQKFASFHEGDKNVRLDPNLLKHILINLFSNAIKFSPENSTIAVLTKRHTNGEVYISVADKGIGISKEDQQHLFERFFRGFNVSNIPGTGLGLHIVSKYVEMMNGKIKCQSELDNGTDFQIIFKPENSIEI